MTDYRRNSKQTPVLSVSGRCKLLHRTIIIDTKWWKIWLEKGETFYFQGENMGFTVRAEKRRQRFFWYAFKKMGGKTRKRYIGTPEFVTLDKLLEVEKMLGNLLDELALATPSVSLEKPLPASLEKVMLPYTLPVAQQAWDNPEQRFKVESGLYFMRRGDWLYQIQSDGKKWQIFAYFENILHALDVEFATLKIAQSIVFDLILLVDPLTRQVTQRFVRYR